MSVSTTGSPGCMGLGLFTGSYLHYSSLSLSLLQYSYSSKGNTNQTTSYFSISATIYILTLNYFILSYRENWALFLRCRGKSESFLFNTNDFYSKVEHGSLFKTPWYHPGTFCTRAVYFSSIFFVPFGYIEIFRFRRYINNKFN